MCILGGWTKSVGQPALEHGKGTHELTHVKRRLCNTHVLLSRTQYVHPGWDVALLPDLQDAIEKTAEEWLAFLIKAIQE